MAGDQRDSHDTQQRSFFDSASSSRTPSSRDLIHDYSPAQDDDTRTAPSRHPPAPVVPQRKHSLSHVKGESSRGGPSRRRSSRNTAQAEWRGRNILVPDSYDNLNELEGPPPVDRRERRYSTLEGERAESRQSKKAPRSRRSSLRSSLWGRNGGIPGGDPEVTELRPITDASGANAHKRSVSTGYVALKPTPRQRIISSFATRLYTVSYLVLFAILGTLARLGLQALTFYPGAPVVLSELWANFGGTVFMGFLSEDRRLFQQEWGQSLQQNDEEKGVEKPRPEPASHAQVKKTIPLYIGLATGFCGSFTSFSSFMRDAFFALSNDLPSPINHPYPPGTPVSTSSTVSRNGGYSVMAVLAVIIITMALCYSALRVGAHIAICLDPFTPVLPFPFVRKVLDRIVVFVAWGAWIGAVIMAIWPPDGPGGPQSKESWAHESWRGQAIFACAFSPVGCLLRFYISLLLNSVVPSFPLGTFTVNMFGTAVLGMAYDLQHVAIGNSGLAGGGRVSCQVLQGVMDGFCGALTTISTYILELNGLKRRHSYIYGATSVVAGFGILVAVMGGVRWTVGFTTAACVT